MSDPRRQQREQRRQRDLVIAKALRNRDETREKLLAQGRELARRRAENVERSRERGGDRSGSTVSSSHSTLPAMDSNEEAAARRSHSTVPAQPKGSTVPAAERLYGLGLYGRIRAGDKPPADPASDGASNASGPVQSASDGDAEEGEQR